MARAFRVWRALFKEVYYDRARQEVEVTSIVKGAERNDGRPVIVTFSRAHLEEWLRNLDAAEKENTDD